MRSPDQAPYVNFRAVAWAMARPIAGLHRLALIEIARHANHSGHAWPSMATLASRLGVTPRHARRIIQELEHTSYVSRIFDSGRRTIFALDPASIHSTDQHTFAVASPQTPDTHVRGPDQTPDTHVRGPRTPMSGVPPDTHVRLRESGKAIDHGRTPDARSAKAPTAGHADSPREEERRSIALAWESLSRAWKRTDLGPLTRKTSSPTAAKKALMTTLAPAVKTYGKNETVTAVSVAINQAEQRGTTIAFEAVLKKGIATLEEKARRPKGAKR